MSAATTLLRQGMDRALAAWRMSPAPAFFAWWGGELAACLPPRWRAVFGAGATWYLLRVAGAEWRVNRAGDAQGLATGRDDQPAAAPQAALAGAWRGVETVDRRRAV
ncbi:MAG TPA: fimbrial assembly protein, partial [Rhodanobacter sp.]|nr:fimbrial assembly protein [Rhodanobacter sp.]